MLKSWKLKQDVKTVFDVVSQNLSGLSLQGINEWFERSDNMKYSVVGLKRACVLIQNTHSPIYIVGDYDVDGKCASAILWHTLTRIGKDVHIRIPRRFSEGYGINESIIDEIAAEVKGEDALIITVDNGITAHAAIEKARKIGYSVLLTDHHQAIDVNDLPNADVVIDPNAETGADFKGYCGAGIAFKLSERLLEQCMMGRGTTEESNVFIDKLLTLAAIATVADSVPLVEENYVFVRKGLKLLSDGVTFEGIKALMNVFYLDGHVTEKDVGYKLGPAINADNRLSDTATLALDLLCCDTKDRAYDYAAQMKGVNEQRKTLVKEMMERAEKVIAGYGMQNDFPIICNLGKSFEGLTGIIAGKIAEEYKAPAIILVETDDGAMKGSARSIAGFDIYSFLKKSLSLMVKFGGHPMAAGLSVEKGNFREWKKFLFDIANGIARPENEEVSSCDLEITVEQVPEMLQEVRKYAPYGEGNREPVFMVKGFVTTKIGASYVKRLSSDGVKFLTANNVSAVGFGISSMIDEPSAPENYTFIGTLSENWFKDQSSPQIDILDFEKQ